MKIVDKNSPCTVKPASVIVVEDDEETQEYICMVLKSTWQDINLVFTSFGEEAVRLVKEESPDLVILDLGLPDITGFQVLENIRSFSNCPVLILTINGIDRSKARAMSLGANKYMNKPFVEEELIATIEQVISAANNQGSHN